MANGKILAGHQLKMTFQQGSKAGHWKAVREMLRRYSPHISPSLAAKMILMELSEISKANPSLGPLEACRALGGLQGTPGDSKAPCPDLARAHVPDRETTTTKNKSSDAENGTKIDALARCIRDLDWYGAKLTGGATPISLAAKIVDAYPAVDHCAAARQASAWLLANPSKRKTQLPKFLLGWISRAGDPKPWAESTRAAARRKPRLDTEAGRQQAWDEYLAEQRGKNGD